MEGERERDKIKQNWRFMTEIDTQIYRRIKSSRHTQTDRRKKKEMRTKEQATMNGGDKK